MPANSRRTVLTGLGVLSPIGSKLSTFWAAALAGTCGVRPIQLLDVSPLPCRIGGEILDYDPKSFVPAINKDGRKSLKNMARYALSTGRCFNITWYGWSYAGTCGR